MSVAFRLLAAAAALGACLAFAGQAQEAPSGGLPMAGGAPAAPAASDPVVIPAPGPPAAASAAVLRGLDKVTGKARDFRAPIGKPVIYGGLSIVVRACVKRPPEETPEVEVFLEVSDRKKLAARPADPRSAAIFSGWMFASSPALNALEHPVYDVWAIDCRA